VYFQIDLWMLKYVSKCRNAFSYYPRLQRCMFCNINYQTHVSATKHVQTCTTSISVLLNSKEYWKQQSFSKLVASSFSNRTQNRCTEMWPVAWRSSLYPDCFKWFLRYSDIFLYIHLPNWTPFY
jgi:hypothetical protein